MNILLVSYGPWYARLLSEFLLGRHPGLLGDAIAGNRHGGARIASLAAGASWVQNLRRAGPKEARDKEVLDVHGHAYLFISDNSLASHVKHKWCMYVCVVCM